MTIFLLCIPAIVGLIWTLLICWGGKQGDIVDKADYCDRIVVAIDPAPPLSGKNGMEIEPTKVVIAGNQIEADSVEEI